MGVKLGVREGVLAVKLSSSYYTLSWVRLTVKLSPSWYVTLGVLDGVSTVKMSSSCCTLSWVSVTGCQLLNCRLAAIR